MVWLYDRTGSLLVIMLMHASVTASTMILQPPIAGVPALTYNLVLAAALYVVMAVAALVNNRHPSRHSLQTGAA